MTHRADFDRDRDWALLPQPAVSTGVQTEIFETAPDNFAQDAARLGQGEYHVAEKPQKKPNAMRISNGQITAEIDRHGYLSFYNQHGEVLTREYVRNRNDLSEFCVPLGLQARSMLPVPGPTVRPSCRLRLMRTSGCMAWVSTRKIFST
ncbi:MAG: hypothetical protein EOM13_08575 [Clostridia bacterium]|nr:hypothetical protein [Clostridia bacterium]